MMSTNRSRNRVQNADKARISILREKGYRHTTWRDLAQKYGVPAGTLCAFAKGREIKNPHYRARLGLPAMVPAPACPKCGEVHVTRRCTRRESKPGRSLFDWPLAELRRALIEREEV